MVDETVLGRVALGLEGAEEGLLGTEDLNGRGRVLGQVGERTGVRDQAGSDRVADQGGQVGRDDAHLFREVTLQALAVVVQVNDAGGKVFDVEVVDFGNVGSHRGARGVEDVAREGLVVVEQLGEGLEDLVGELRLVAEEVAHFRVLVVVGHDADEFGEVPAVPLADAHRKRVDVLVELVEQRDGLDDHVVGPVHVELDLGARVGVAETELGPLRVAFLEAGEELFLVLTDPAEDGERAVGRVAVDAERRLDRRRETALLDAEDDARLFREVQLEQAVQELVNDTCEEGWGASESVLSFSFAARGLILQ